jgi:hypothetical protein
MAPPTTVDIMVFSPSWSGKKYPAGRIPTS